MHESSSLTPCLQEQFQSVSAAVCYALNANIGVASYEFDAGTVTVRGDSLARDVQATSASPSERWRLR